MNWLMLGGREAMPFEQRARVRRSALVGGIMVAAVIIAMLGFRILL